MELTDLTHDEQLALVALIEVVVSADREVSDEELAHVDRIAAALGDETYQALTDEADERFTDEDDLRDFLAGIERQEARELIYGTALEAALPDTVETRESSLLGWLATAWSISIRFDQPPS